jgi:hypothetical protein
VRTAIFAFLQEVMGRDWTAAAERNTGTSGVGVASEALRVETAFKPYLEAHPRFRLDPAGRAAVNTHWLEENERDHWTVAQVLIDDEDANDWEAMFVVDLARSRAEQRAIVRFETVRAIGSWVQPPECEAG